MKATTLISMLLLAACGSTQQEREVPGPYLRDDQGRELHLINAPSLQIWKFYDFGDTELEPGNSGKWDIEDGKLLFWESDAVKPITCNVTISKAEKTIVLECPLFSGAFRECDTDSLKYSRCQ